MAPGTSGHRKTQKNFTAKDAQNAFLVICATEVMYKEMYDMKVKQQSSVPPCISIIGTMLDPKEVFIDFENVTYKVNTVAKAIDICFKAYHVFNFEYPPAARLTWQFINAYFFGIKDSNTYPAVHTVIKDIRGNKTNICAYNRFKKYIF